MVKTTQKESKEIYLCGECGLGYENIITAEECEDHCKRYNSCSLKITKHAVIK